MCLWPDFHPEQKVLQQYYWQVDMLIHGGYYFLQCSDSVRGFYKYFSQCSDSMRRFYKYSQRTQRQGVVRDSDESGIHLEGGKFIRSYYIILGLVPGTREADDLVAWTRADEILVTT